MRIPTKVCAIIASLCFGFSAFGAIKITSPGDKTNVEQCPANAEYSVVAAAGWTIVQNESTTMRRKSLTEKSRRDDRAYKQHLACKYSTGLHVSKQICSSGYVADIAQQKHSKKKCKILGRYQCSTKVWYTDGNAVCRSMLKHVDYVYNNDTDLIAAANKLCGADGFKSSKGLGGKAVNFEYFFHETAKKLGAKFECQL